MKNDMEMTLTFRRRQEATTRLLRHCLSLGTAEHRVPARTRLDEAVGPDLARRLVASLTVRERTY